MTAPVYDRRSFLIGAGLSGAAFLTGPLPLIRPVHARADLAPTLSMRGGSNNYSANAPLVENLGTGFLVFGTVRKMGAGEPLANVRIQVWAATNRGGERESSNHGSVMTAVDGSFKLEMSQIVPNFGQPHAHLAYDDAHFQTVFLRPVMSSPDDTSVEAHFVLAVA